MKTVLQVSLCILASGLFLGCSTKFGKVVPTETPFALSSARPTAQIMLTDSPDFGTEPIVLITPTNDLESARARIKQLLQTNNGCKLPCFWGITPGKTSWAETVFLQDLASQYNDNLSQGDQGVHEGNFYFSIESQLGADMNLKIDAFKNIVRALHVSDFDAPSFHLANFLSSNGQPDEIWVFTYSRGYEPDNHIGLAVLFYYREKQMTADFYGTGHVGDIAVTGCTTLGPGLHIWAWDKSLGFPESALDEMEPIRGSWKPIQEATKGRFSVGSYYQTFKNPEAEPCIETPKEMWPSP
jgi:hypothetical protein